VREVYRSALDRIPETHSVERCPSCIGQGRDAEQAYHLARRAFEDSVQARIDHVLGRIRESVAPTKRSTVVRVEKKTLFGWKVIETTHTLPAAHPIGRQQWELRGQALAHANLKAMATSHVEETGITSAGALVRMSGHPSEVSGSGHSAADSQCQIDGKAMLRALTQLAEQRGVTLDPYAEEIALAEAAARRPAEAGFKREETQYSPYGKIVWPPKP